MAVRKNAVDIFVKLCHELGVEDVPKVSGIQLTAMVRAQLVPMKGYIEERNLEVVRTNMIALAEVYKVPLPKMPDHPSDRAWRLLECLVELCE